MAKKKSFSQGFTGLTAKSIRFKLLKTLRAGEKITEHQREFLINMLQDVEDGRSPSGALGLTGKQGRKIDENRLRDFEVVRRIEELLLNHDNYVTSIEPKTGKERVFDVIAKETRVICKILSEKEAGRLQDNGKMSNEEISQIIGNKSSSIEQIVKSTKGKAVSEAQMKKLLGRNLFVINDGEMIKLSLKKLSADRIEGIYYDSRKQYHEYIKFMQAKPDLV